MAHDPDAQGDPFRSARPPLSDEMPLDKETAVDEQSWLEGRSTSPGGAGTTPSAHLAEPGLPPAPPGYEAVRVLGRGGMGVVYLARHTALNREVAIKVILSGQHASAVERTRFLAEAEAVAALNHPGIVQVHDFGTWEGLPYMVFEFCPGGSLASRLAGGPLSPLAAATVVEAVARAVQAAHDRRIVHRDLKPHNILMGADDAPKVADFGLAKRLGGGEGLTVTGAIMGTPSYMAPEQARGDTSGVGPFTDVYSLGAILYECLTGRPPFKGASPVETLSQVLGSAPPRVRSLNPRVPGDLETVCLKCLEKDPARRYPSAVALADDLRSFLSGRRTVARPPGLPARFARWVGRNRIAALAVVSVLAVLVALAVATLVATAGRNEPGARIEPGTQREAEATRPQPAATPTKPAPATPPKPAPPRPPLPPAPSEEEAVRWVEGVGGKVTRSRPGGPVIAVDLAINKKVTNDGLNAVRGFKELKKLVLYFDGQVTDAGMLPVGELTGLDTLDLSNTGISDAGVAELNGLCGLKSLHLAGCMRTTDDAATTVKGFTELEDLSLPSTFTNRGVRQLTPLTKLRKLYLSGTTMDDYAIKTLTGFTELEELYLGSGVTDRGLAELKALTKLKRLSVSGSKVTPEGIESLQQSLPDCSISR